MKKLLVALLLLAPAALVAQGRTSGTAVQIEAVGGPHVCLDARQGRDHDGDPVQIFNCNGTVAQQWTVTSSADNKHAIVGIGGYCLDVRGENATGTGVPAQLWKCHFGDNQRFMLQPDGHLMEVRSRKCLVVSAPHDGAPVVLAPCGNAPGENWMFVPR